MNISQLTCILLTLFTVLVTTAPTHGDSVSDIYLSLSGFGVGNASAETQGVYHVGDSASAYIWVNDSVSIDTGAFVDISSSNSNVIRFTGAEVFNAQILDSVTLEPNGMRWTSTGPGTITDHFIDELRAFRFISGTGILPEQASHASGTQFDSLHDPTSSAFLFARLDFDVVGLGESNVSLSEGVGLIVNDGTQINATFGDLNIRSVPEVSGLLPLGSALITIVLRRQRRYRGWVMKDGR